MHGSTYAARHIFLLLHHEFMPIMQWNSSPIMFCSDDKSFPFMVVMFWCHLFTKIDVLAGGSIRIWRGSKQNASWGSSAGLAAFWRGRAKAIPVTWRYQYCAPARWRTSRSRTMATFSISTEEGSSPLSRNWCSIICKTKVNCVNATAAKSCWNTPCPPRIPPRSAGFTVPSMARRLSGC